MDQVKLGVVIKNTGFRRPTITEDNHILGGLGSPKTILCPDRNWLPYIPDGEIQRRRIETSSCTEFGTTNAIETLESRQFSSVSNYSERFVAIGSGNDENGNDPHVVAEWIRANGLVGESILPFDDSIDSFAKYLSPNPLTQELKDIGKQWLTIYKLNHEYVFKDEDSLKDKQKKLLEALQYSPIGVSVTAWRKGSDSYYKEPGDQDNHWTLLINGEEGKPWTVNDSYLDDGEFIKKLDWNYDFGTAKLYILNRISIPIPLPSLWRQLRKYLCV